jgi:Hemerythrin HHE cation binding domain
MPEDDVVDFLLGQHARIEELFATVIKSQGKARARAFDELADLLEVHEMAEQQLVHPLARNSIDAGPDVVAARLAEEQKASELLTALRAKGVTHPGFDSGIVALRDAVLAHATYEERYEFTQLRQHNSIKQLRTAAAAVEQAQATTPPGGAS